MRRVAVIGLGTLGANLAMALVRHGVEVLAIDKDERYVEEIQDQVTSVAIIDTTKEKNLWKINPDELDAILITIGERFVEESILTTFLLSMEDGPDLYVRTVNELHRRIIERIGVKKAFNPEEDFAERLAQSLARPSILEMYAVSADGYVISDVLAPSAWVGKTLKELDLRGRHGLTVLSIKRKILRITAAGVEEATEKTEHNPPAHALIQRRDILVCFGELKELEAIAQESLEQD
jgi:trk system potassium uptake protein TrkA